GRHDHLRDASQIRWYPRRTHVLPGGAGAALSRYLRRVPCRLPARARSLQAARQDFASDGRGARHHRRQRLRHLQGEPARKLLHALSSDGSGDVEGAHQRAKLALVFPGERGTSFSGWSKAKSALDTASGVSGWWLHDLRRTLATGLQRLGVRLEVTEA